MNYTTIALYSWDTGAFIMIAVFALVIAGLIGFVVRKISKGKNKK